MSDEQRDESEEKVAERRLLPGAEPASRVPVLPVPRHYLPWILGVLSVLLIASGLLFGERGALLLGVLGLCATLVAFPLARILLGAEADEDA